MDAGMRAVRMLRDGLMMEEEWITDRERGFSWKAHNLIQHIDASPVFVSRETDVSLLTVRTPVVSRVSNPPEKVDKFLLDLNMFAAGSALTLERETGTIISVLAHQVHDATLEFRVHQLYLMALLQLTHAETSASALGAIAKGEIAVDDSLPRPNGPHEILGLPRELIEPEMKSPSRFAEHSELQSVYALVYESPFASQGWWEGGITIEVPFGPHDTSLIELRNDIEHPSLGAGLAVRTTLRTEFVDSDPAKLAVDLQRLQLSTVDGGGQIGAWGFRSDLDFAHVAWSRFVPNVLFRPGVTADIAMGEINRALWCDATIFPGLPARNAWELMIAREKLRADAGKGGFVA